MEGIMVVHELMTRNVVTIGPGASGHEAVEVMAKNTMRHLPVVTGDGTVAGMLTDRDIRHHLFRPEVFSDVGTVDVQSLLKKVTVSEMMSWPPVTTTPETKITEAASQLRGARVGSLLVVEGDRLLGIITQTDLLRELVRADGWCCPDVETIVVSYP
jgi:acetoin utilization protein AcuB